MSLRTLQIDARARWLLPVVMLFSLPLLLGAAPAQVGTPCDPGSGCFDISVYPASAVADVYLDGTLVAEGVNSARLTGAPATPHTIEARNMQDPGAVDYGRLFVYPDLSQITQTYAGYITRVYFYPRRQYIRGTLTYICQPFGYQPGDDVACRPNIDGVTQADVPAGMTTQFVVTPDGPDDRDILAFTGRLYDQKLLHHAHYAAFRPIADTPMENADETPIERERRLYEADYLLRQYGFSPGELPYEKSGRLPLGMDVKLAWALRHPELFPMELLTASRRTFLFGRI